MKEDSSYFELFHEIGSSASLLAVSRLFDLVGRFPGHVIQQSDAPSVIHSKLAWRRRNVDLLTQTTMASGMGTHRLQTPKLSSQVGPIWSPAVWLELGKRSRECCLSLGFTYVDGWEQ